MTVGRAGGQRRGYRPPSATVRILPLRPQGQKRSRAAARLWHEDDRQIEARYNSLLPMEQGADFTGSVSPFPSGIKEIQQRLTHLSEAVTADRKSFPAGELQIPLPEPVNKGQIDQNSSVAVDELGFRKVLRQPG